MFTHSTLPFLLTALSYLAVTSAVPDTGNDGSPAYIGCLDGEYIPADYDELDVDDAATCATECYTTYGSTYAYFYPSQPYNKRGLKDSGRPLRRGTSGTDPLCYCSDDGPQPYDYDSAVNDDGSSTCASTDTVAYITTSTFSFQGCYSSAADDVTVDDDDFQGYLSDPETCFRDCIDYPQVSISPFPSGGFICYCGDKEYVGGSATTCTEGALFFYGGHNAGAYAVQASDLVRRQLRERLTRSRATEREAICPSSLNACRVSGTDSFECIDTMSELESCGGCINGDFNSVLSFPTGVDCTALPGAKLGGVTCTRGRCEILACKAGWTLTDGACVHES